MKRLLHRAALLLVTSAAPHVTACATFEPPLIVSKSDAPAEQLVIGSDGSDHVAVLEAGRVRLYDTSVATVIAEGPAPEMKVVAGRIANDGGIVLLSGRGDLFVLRARNGAIVEMVRAAWQDVDRTWRLALGADGAIAVADSRRVAVWPKGDARGAPVVLELDGELFDMAFRHADGALGIAFADRVEVWDVARATRVGTLPGERRVAFSSRGDVATGYAPVSVREAMEIDRAVTGASECEHVVWSADGGALACLAHDAAWICVGSRCDLVPKGGSARAFDFIAATRAGFVLSAGDGRVLRRALDGREAWLLTDAVHDLPRGSR